MKKILILFTAITFGIKVNAQAPQKMSYQTVVRDASNSLLINRAVGMQITILQGSATGTSVYTETQIPTTNANGLISVEIGGGTVASGDFGTIDWSNGPYYIKTETDPDGGTAYSISGTTQLLSVPYALYAETSGNIPTTYSIGDFAQGGIVFWVDETGQHGLVCAKEDQSASIEWNNGVDTLVEAKGDGIGAGMMNTMLIIAKQGANSDNYAAGICAQLVVDVNGTKYGDWYLPSKDELSLMYLNKAVINTTAAANGGSSFANFFYWSSTEFDNGTAWSQNFSNSNQTFYTKGGTDNVRAIRKF